MSGCAYYGDIHSHSRPLTPVRLSKLHTYRPPSAPILASSHWWQRFKDPQLNQLIEEALCDSPTLQIAISRLKRAQHLTEEVSSLLWPTIDFEGYVQRQRFSTFGLAPPPFNGRTFNIGTLALNFNYEFDFWGKNRQLLFANIHEACAAQAELLEARLILSTAVASTYFQLRSNLEQVSIAASQWQASQQILQIASVRFKRGIDSDIPVKTIQANAQAQKQTLEQYRQAALLSQHQLAVLLGRNPFTTEITVKPWVFHAYQVALPPCMPASLLAQRPDIYAAKFRAEAAANYIKVAKARFFPNINLNGLFSYQSVGLGRLFNPQSQNNAITGTVDLPIFDAGARRANLRVRYAEYDLAVNEYNQTILTALREVADQLSVLKTLQAQRQSQAIAVAATARNDQLFRLRYRQGIADYVVVLNSKQSLLQQKAEQIDLQTRHLQAVVAMLKALGGNDTDKGSNA
jgi:NodT family efflux transporter outer membrane factor (OMF) lipoprotein